MSGTATPVELGTYGVWLPHTALSAELATEIERLGYGAIWIGGSPGADLDIVDTVLSATERVGVATGIVNIWSADAGEVAQSYHRIEAAHPGRFLLGIGAGHREVDGSGAINPFQGMLEYLDVLDSRDVPSQRRVLAALGPRMLRLAAHRAAGAHPYLVNSAYTESARDALGAAPLLAVEHKVALGDNRETTLATARSGLRNYLLMANYRENMRRLGFQDADFASGGSERLVDELVAQGDPSTVAVESQAHRSAGADHVCLQPLAHPGEHADVLAKLAPDLGLSGG